MLLWIKIDARLISRLGHNLNGTARVQRRVR